MQLGNKLAFGEIVDEQAPDEPGVVEVPEKVPASDAVPVPVAITVDG